LYLQKEDGVPVAEVIISSWNDGLQKIPMTKLIRQYTSLGLKDAKRCTDRVLDGEQVVLAVDSDQQAMQFVEQLSAIGAVAGTHPGTASEPRRLSVLMPVYNEEDTVTRIIGEVLALPLDLELIVVDDGSTDETRARLHALEAAHDPHLKIVYAPQNVGKGAAIRAALAHATGEVVVIQDADCEYDPRDFLPMMERIERGGAVVYGTRLSPEAARLNREVRDKFYVARRLLPWLTNALFGTQITDEATCYKMFRRDVLMSIPLRCARFDFCPEVTAKIIRRGYKIYETPIRYHPRTEAQGKKIGWRDAFDAAWALLKFRLLD